MHKLKFVLLFFAVLALNSCKEEPQLWKPSSEQQVIGDYIAAHPDQFSEFEKLAALAGMQALLRIRGPYTVLLPNNEGALPESFHYQFNFYG
jgi:hypothetical protein